MAGDDSYSGDADEAGSIGGTTVLTLDTVFELLANRRRRFVIYSLLDTPNGVMAFDDLVDDVVRLEPDERFDAGADDRREAIAADLHYWHLPVLEDVGVVAYDDRSEVVQYEDSPLLEEWAERVKVAEVPD